VQAPLAANALYLLLHDRRYLLYKFYIPILALPHSCDSLRLRGAKGAILLEVVVELVKLALSPELMLLRSSSLPLGPTNAV
jgi:hypothetical protein